MNTVPESPPTAPAPGLLGRVIGVLTSPRATFEHVVAEPSWLVVLAVSVVISGVLGALIGSADFTLQGTLDDQRRMMESLGQEFTPEMEEQTIQAMENAVWFALGGVLVAFPIWYLILAGLLHGFGAGILGAQVAFRQTFAVVVYAGVITVVGGLFSVPLQFALQTIDTLTTLAAFAPMLDNEAFLYRLLASFELFTLWWIVVGAIGLSVLWRRKTRPIATTFLVLYAVLAVAWAAVRYTFGF